MESVRAAVGPDLPRCVELLTEASREAGGVRGGALLAALGGFGGAGAAAGPGAPVDLARVVGDWYGAGSLRVGTIDDVVVGLAAGTVAVGERTVGRVECCYVEPAARGVGVGLGLVSALLAWFGERECSDVDAFALPGDRSMKQLLETAGFKTRLLVLHRSPS